MEKSQIKTLHAFMKAIAEREDYDLDELALAMSPKLAYDLLGTFAELAEAVITTSEIVKSVLEKKGASGIKEATSLLEAMAGGTAGLALHTISEFLVDKDDALAEGAKVMDVTTGAVTGERTSETVQPNTFTANRVGSC
jgi:hypothetical protein